MIQVNSLTKTYGKVEAVQGVSFAVSAGEVYGLLLLLEAIDEVARGGTAVLLTTHYMDEAERVCDRVDIIDNGVIIKEGALDELRAAVEDVQIFSLRGRIDRAAMAEFVASLSGVDVVNEGDGEIVLSLSSHASGDASRLLETAAAIENITEVAIKPPSLESLFIRLTGRNTRE